MVQPSNSLQSSLKEDVKNLLKNRPWIILAIVGIVSFVMFAMQNAAIAYYFKYYIGKEDNVQMFNVIGTVALIVALPPGACDGPVIGREIFQLSVGPDVLTPWISDSSI